MDKINNILILIRNNYFKDKLKLKYDIIQYILNSLNLYLFDFISANKIQSQYVINNYLIQYIDSLDNIIYYNINFDYILFKHIINDKKLSTVIGYDDKGNIIYQEYIDMFKQYIINSINYIILLTNNINIYGKNGEYKILLIEDISIFLLQDLNNNIIGIRIFFQLKVDKLDTYLIKDINIEPLEIKINESIFYRKNFLTDMSTYIEDLSSINNVLSEEEVNRRNNYIIDSLYSLLKKSRKDYLGVNELIINDINFLYTMLDYVNKIFFNNTVLNYFNFKNYKLVLCWNKLCYKSTAGKCIVDRKCKAITINISINLIFNALTNAIGEPIGKGRSSCSNLIHCLLITLEHELVHAIINVQKYQDIGWWKTGKLYYRFPKQKIKAGHGITFMSIYAGQFNQDSYYHSLNIITKEHENKQKKIQNIKDQLYKGKRIKFNYKGNILESIVQRVNPITVSVITNDERRFKIIYSDIILDDEDIILDDEDNNKKYTETIQYDKYKYNINNIRNKLHIGMPVHVHTEKYGKMIGYITNLNKNSVTFADENATEYYINYKDILIHTKNINIPVKKYPPKKSDEIITKESMKRLLETGMVVFFTLKNIKYKGVITRQNKNTATVYLEDGRNSKVPYIYILLPGYNI